MGAVAESRTYKRREAAVFCKTTEEFGGLSNMAGGFPLRVNGVDILTSEALYQACRFPHMPDVQRLIIDQRSPMTAKMKSKPFRSQSRKDWDSVRVRVMRWCLRVKLAQNWVTFNDLLLSTADRPIVEESRKDDFWGAFAEDDGTLIGCNVLGRLLMELREQLRKPTCEALKRVEPVPIPDFNLFGQPIQPVQAWRMPSEPVVDPDLARTGRCLWDQVDEPSPRLVESPNLGKQKLDVRPAAQFRESVSTGVTVIRRLIEVDLPIARISAHARREKDMRLGHIPSLHIYPAARPPAACRAVTLAALWPDPADEHCPQSFRDAAAKHLIAFAKRVCPERITEEKAQLQSTVSTESLARWEVFAKNSPPLDAKEPAHQNVLRFALLDFIADFANWDNSTVPAYLETTRALTQAAHEALGGEPGTRPLVADPFAGGGAIPLESLRAGADAFASDLNPLAVLINRVVLEYVPEFGEKLIAALDQWLEKSKKEIEEKLASYYPTDSEGGIPVAFLWARTVLSEAPDGSKAPVELPLLRSMWLARKGRNVALRWVRDPNGAIILDKQDVTYSDNVKRTIRRPRLEVFQPRAASEVEKGIVNRFSATCPVTGFTTRADRVRIQLNTRMGGANDARLYCVVTMPEDGRGRTFRVPTKKDMTAYHNAAQGLAELEAQSKGPFPLVPNEPFPPMSGVFNAPLYGHSTWGSLFNYRQLLALSVYCSSVQAYVRRVSEGNSRFGSAVAAMLGLLIDRLADLNASLCVWQLNTPNNAHVFGRWALPMVMDYAEVNPLADAGGSPTSVIRRATAVIRYLMDGRYTSGHVTMASATDQVLPDDSVQLLFTDPPYYNAIPYADISDFFYVWLRRSVYPAHSDILSTDLSPKDDEICEMSGWDPVRYPQKDKRYFEDRMTRAFLNARKYLQPSAIGVVVFAHKTTAGWEAMLNSLIEAGFVITASWPIDTEMASRLRAKGSAALASSVHLVCRPRENPDGSVSETVGEWRDVLGELPKRIHEWMPRLAAEGVVGADAIFACLGPALEVYSRYSRVEKANGEPATLREYLEFVWAAVSTEALSLIFKEADASGLEPDARLTAMWLWTLGGGSGNGNGKAATAESADEESVTEEDEEEETSSKSKAKTSGFILEFDAARKIAQGLGVHLEQCGSLVEIKGDKARLLPVAERTAFLFGKGAEAATVGKGRKAKAKQRSLFEELSEAENESAGWGELHGPAAGTTVLDRVHQSMILFAANRGELLKRFLVEDGIGKDPRFWKLADNLNKLYPPGTDERRWIEGVLARKKGLGL